MLRPCPSLKKPHTSILINNLFYSNLGYGDCVYFMMKKLKWHGNDLLSITVRADRKLRLPPCRARQKLQASVNLFI